jgi:AAA+ ATPase superfamily predicted ATPase
MTASKFIGRTKELALLENDFLSSKSEFCVLFGRRRIGKSTLLEKFTENHNAFNFLAGKESKQIQLNRFVSELGKIAGEVFFKKIKITEWHEALDLLDRCVPILKKQNKGKKALFIFDEFQWMCNGCPELISDLQRFWDRNWKNSGSIFLILCGSSISFMLGEVLSRKSPLFGRRTRSIVLSQFGLIEAAEFLHGKNIFEITETYMLTGGVPKYLELFSEKTSFRKNVERNILSPEGFLFDEVQFILSEQLKEKEHYFQVLRELALAPLGVSDLCGKTSIPTGQISYYLERLQMLGFVSRHISFSSPETTRKIRYRLNDYYLRFYFTFIFPNQEGIQSGMGRASFAEHIGPGWNPFAGYAFESIVREHAGYILNKEGMDTTAFRTGSYWQKPTKRKKGVQIDLLIECRDNITFVCECKWSREKTINKVVQDLVHKLALYPNKKRHTLVPVLVAAGGADKAVVDGKQVRIVTLEDFFQA